MPIRRNPGSCGGGGGGKMLLLLPRIPGTVREIYSGSFSGPFVPVIQRDCPPVFKLVTHAVNVPPTSTIPGLKIQGPDLTGLLVYCDKLIVLQPRS